MFSATLGVNALLLTRETSHGECILKLSSLIWTHVDVEAKKVSQLVSIWSLQSIKLHLLGIQKQNSIRLSRCVNLYQKDMLNENISIKKIV